MNSVIDFWFSKSNQPLWFKKNDEFDHAISVQFSILHAQAKQAELWSWRKTAEGRLAEVIVLDQFSRNLFRGSTQAFAQDSLALALAQEAVYLKMDQDLLPKQRAFLYMPFMHSESKKIHEFAVQLFTDLGNAHNLDFEYKHQAIIEKFGRYPHRNQILGRNSTVEELEFLKQPNSHF